MSYGIEVFDSVGATVFNSNMPIELAAFNGTVVGTDEFSSAPSGTQLLTIPDYLFGDDQHGYAATGENHTVYQPTSSYPTYSNNKQIAFDITSITQGGASGFFFVIAEGAPNIGSMLRTTSGTDIDTVASATLAGFTSDGSLVSHYTNAYWLIEVTSANISSHRVDNATKVSHPYDDSFKTDMIYYARPVSSSYSGRFRLAISNANRTAAIYDATGGNNSFEIMVAMKASDYGSITSTTAHQLAGNMSYGLRAVTAADQKYTANSTAEPHLTFESATYISKAFLTKGYSGGTTGTNSTQSLGSLSTSSNKRWCRMNSTIRFKVQTVFPTNFLWYVYYQWNSNNSISLSWRHGATAFVLSSTMNSKAPYAVVEFGDGV